MNTKPIIENQILEAGDEEERKANRIELWNQEASKGKRFANFLLDRLFILIIAFVLGILFAVVSPALSIPAGSSSTLVELLVSLIVTVLYYAIFEGSTGRSPAKYITGTKVVTEDGEKPPVETILLRSLCRCIPFDALSFLFANEGWHDRLSKTIVVDVKKTPDTMKSPVPLN